VKKIGEGSSSAQRKKGAACRDRKDCPWTPLKGKKKKLLLQKKRKKRARATAKKRTFATDKKNSSRSVETKWKKKRNRRPRAEKKKRKWGSDFGSAERERKRKRERWLKRTKGNHAGRGQPTWHKGILHAKIVLNSGLEGRRYFDGKKGGQHVPQGKKIAGERGPPVRKEEKEMFAKGRRLESKKKEPDDVRKKKDARPLAEGEERLRKTMRWGVGNDVGPVKNPEFSRLQKRRR